MLKTTKLSKKTKSDIIQEKREHIFKYANPWKAIFKMVLPTIVAQLIIASYNVIDKIIATNFGINYMISIHPQLTNETAKTIINIATSYANTVSSITFAFSLLVSIGTSIKTSIALGQKNYLSIKENVGTGIVLSLGIATCLTILMWFLALPIIEFQANSKIIDLNKQNIAIVIKEALNYSHIIIGGMIFLFGANFWIMLFRSEGRILTIIVINIITFIINVGLDFALVFKFGISGTGYATIFSWFLILMSALTIIYISQSRFKIRWINLKFKWKLARGILALGISSLLENIAYAIIIMITARILHNLPSPPNDNNNLPIYVSLSSGISPWLIILNAPIIGLGYGARALVGYAYGQRQFRKIWKYMWRLSLLLIIILSIITIIVATFGQNMLMIFGVSYDVANTYKIFIIMQFAFYPLATFSYIAIILFQSTNHPKLALFSSVQRTIFMPTICLVIGFFISNMLNNGFYYYLFIGFIDLFASLTLIPILITTLIKNRQYIFKDKIFS